MVTAKMLVKGVLDWWGREGEWDGDCGLLGLRVCESNTAWGCRRVICSRFGELGV